MGGFGFGVGVLALLTDDKPMLGRLGTAIMTTAVGAVWLSWITLWLRSGCYEPGC